jgi:Domain of unknown function (DUF305)
MMMPHHQGAIDMAKAELLYGKDPVMRRLAEEIIVDQQSEIQAMQLWLSKQPTTTMLLAERFLRRAQSSPIAILSSESYATTKNPDRN